MVKFPDYQARIAFLKKMSGYHFDPFLSEEKPFQILGHFVGSDWMAEIRSLIEEAQGGSTFGFSHCVDAGKEQKRPNPQFDLCSTEEKNYSAEHVFLKRLKGAELKRGKAPTIFKMVDWFGFEPSTVIPRIHIQHPGQIFPVHVDGLMNHKKSDDIVHDMKKRPDSWARVQVQLEDWIWGHVWGVGTHHWTQWRAGEIMYHPWWKYPHYTANCGFAPRYSLQITGEVTDVTRQRFEKTHGDIDLRAL